MTIETTKTPSVSNTFHIAQTLKPKPAERRVFFRPKFPTHYNTLHHVATTHRYHYSIYHKPYQTPYPFETCSLDACRTTSHHNNLTSAEVSHTTLITAFAFTLLAFIPYESRNLFPRRVPHRCVGNPLKVSRACKRVYYLFNSAIFSAWEYYKSLMNQALASVFPPIILLFYKFIYIHPFLNFFIFSLS